MSASPDVGEIVLLEEERVLDGRSGLAMTRGGRGLGSWA
jgi:hypothetical protein